MLFSLKPRLPRMKAWLPLCGWVCIHAAVLAQGVADNQLPTGGQVRAGSATITQSGNTLQINQTSQRAVVDWSTFNIGSQAQVQIQQPNAQSATLNRVNDINPSQILGRITAPGQVVLVNPQGVYFGKSASVDVGGIVATTHQISNTDFMEGRSVFNRAGSKGSVINEGEIRAALGGYIAMLAPNVQNKGIVIANLGTVAMAAGEQYELQFDTTGYLKNIRVTGATIDTMVSNQHAVRAPGGLVILSALAASKLQSAVVNNGGIIEANGMSRQGGRIVLTASTSISNTGTIQADATAPSAGQSGGPAGVVSLDAPTVTNAGIVSASNRSLQDIDAMRSASTNWVGSVAGAIEVLANTFQQTATGLLDVSAVAGAAGSVKVQASDAMAISGQV
ncbi:MAG: hypothetical protein RLZZ24_1232, partial [Pseudomonadota bacterium]